MADIEVIRIIVVAAAALGGLSLISAVARRIAGPYGRRVVGLDPPGWQGRALDDLRDEVAQLRSEVAALHARDAELDELQSRLDFAERMLAQTKDRDALPGRQP